MTPTHNTHDREALLNEVLLAYVEADQAGKAPSASELCARHPDLADDLREFLAGRERVEKLAAPLRAAAGLSGPPRKAPETSPELGEIGDFRLLREVGRGGMGVVYEAEQISLRRRVALKVLPFAAALDPKLLQRFRNEAQAAAGLHHPNIVPVHAVGTERGVHYYAMQFVEGQSVAALLESLRNARRQAPGRLSADTLRNQAASTALDPKSAARHRRAAALIVQAAEALEHAHQVGIVHRDVKPANLLLDATGNLWITDFGLALMGADAGLTMTGELVGTLRYMSPEQAAARRGLVDHRTDVYALGVTLYELLTLEPAFDGQGRHELLHQIATEEPKPPRARDRSIPHELETIVLKAMAKVPAERYATAQDLADDLRRFLDDKPIRARRPSPLERLRKWSRRHRAFVTSALALLLLGVVALVVSTVMIAGAHREALASYTREKEQRARAEESFRQARGVVDSLMRLSEEELAHVPHLQGLRRRLLESALEYYQGFIEQRRGDPSSRAELETSRAHVERLLGELSALEGAGHFHLLADRAVQADLGLSAEQRREVGEEARRQADLWREAFTAFRKMTTQQRQARSLEIAREVEKTVAALLTPQQQIRLRQIVLQSQARGPEGLASQAVAGPLKLTAEQKASLRAISEEMHVALWDRFYKGFPPGQRSDDIWRAAEEKSLNILTARQRARWRELTGEPVRLENRLTFWPSGFETPFGPPPAPFGLPRGPHPPPNHP